MAQDRVLLAEVHVIDGFYLEGIVSVALIGSTCARPGLEGKERKEEMAVL